MRYSEKALARSLRFGNTWVPDMVALLVGLLPAGILLARQGQVAGSPTPAPKTAPQNDQAGIIEVKAPSVVVDAIVTDKKGRHASGLTPSDFAVYDNDVLEKIVTFVPPEAASRGLPMSADAERSAANRPESAAPSGVRRQALDVASIRFITLVLDLGGLQPGSIPNARQAAIQYLQKSVAQEDFVSVYRVDHTLHLDVPFTQDKQRAIEALRLEGRSTAGGALTATTRIDTEQEIHELESQVYGFGSDAGPGAGRLSSLGPGDRAFAAQALASLRAYLWTQSIFQARAIYVALRAIAQAYRDLPGRKNVVVFSEGFIHSPEAKTELAAVIDTANRANVAFYIVDAAGLTTGFGAASRTPDDLSGTREAYQVSQEGAGFWYGFSEFDQAKRLGGPDMLHDDLGQVAMATGGLYIKNQNDLLHGLELADSDLREFYTLVYQPTDTRFDGSFHKIKVEVLRSGYSVRYRRGYWAIPPGQELMMTPAAAQLLAALDAGSLKPALTLDVNAALLLAEDGKLSVPVNVSLAGKPVKFESDGRSYRARVTLLLVARDRDRRPVSVHQRFLDLQLDNKKRNDRRKKDLEINARLAVPQVEPLDVQAILQLPDSTIALGDRKLAVPAPRPSVPSLTSVLLSNSIEPAQGAADPSDPLRGENFQLLVQQPRFSSSDKLTVYFGILLDCPAAPTGIPHLRLSYGIESAGKTARVFPAEDLLINASQRSMRVLKQFDLKDLPTGHYMFQVTVRDLVHRGAASQRSDFDIR